MLELVRLSSTPPWSSFYTVCDTFGSRTMQLSGLRPSRARGLKRRDEP